MIVGCIWCKSVYFGELGDAVGVTVRIRVRVSLDLRRVLVPLQSTVPLPYTAEDRCIEKNW